MKSICSPYCAASSKCTIYGTCECSEGTFGPTCQESYSSYNSESFYNRITLQPFKAAYYLIDNSPEYLQGELHISLKAETSMRLQLVLNQESTMSIPFLFYPQPPSEMADFFDVSLQQGRQEYDAKVPIRKKYIHLMVLYLGFEQVSFTLVVNKDKLSAMNTVTLVILIVFASMAGLLYLCSIFICILSSNKD